MDRQVNPGTARMTAGVRTLLGRLTGVRARRTTSRPDSGHLQVGDEVASHPISLVSRHQ